MMLSWFLHEFYIIAYTIFTLCVHCSAWFVYFYNTFTLLFYEKTKRSINKYKEAKQEVDEFIRDINSEYKSIRKEIKDLLSWLVLYSL